MHNDYHIDESTVDFIKPDVITFNNMPKGAVDVGDEMVWMVFYSQNIKPMAYADIFSLLTDAGINSRILLSSVNPPENIRNRRHFLKDLAFSLLEPYMESRQKQEEFLDEPQTKKEN